MVRSILLPLAWHRKDLIHSVPTALVNDLWPAVEPHVSRACEHHPFMSAADVLEVILWGAARLFVVTKQGGVMGFAVMEVVQYPNRKVANVLCCGGEEGFLSVAVHDLLPRLKEWGAEQDADTFALTGRPGWMRALRNEGFEAATHTTLWADLDVERRRQQRHTAADDSSGAVGTVSAVPH